MSHAAIAARAFEKTLEELERQLERQDDAPDLGDPTALGRRAALLGVAEAIWGQHLGPLLDMDQVGGQQVIRDLEWEGLLTLEASGGRKLYPAFQFSPGGRPYAEVAKVLKIFSGAVESPYTIASWFVSPQDVLGGEKPAAWVRSGREPEPLFEAARRAAARLAR